MEGLLELDRELFVFINSRLTTHLFDQTMPIITDLHKQPLFWLIVTSLIIYSLFRPVPVDQPGPIIRRARAKKWAVGIVILATSMGLSDFIAYRGIKVWVQRDRPEAAGVQVILRTDSHSGWSFPSNHAANNFALARTVQILAPPWALPAYAFAALVGFSRIYVGVHYPLDVLGGALVGFLCASLIGWLIQRTILNRQHVAREKTRVNSTQERPS